MKVLAGTLVLALACIAIVGSGVSRTSCPSDFEVRLAAASADDPVVNGTCVVENGKPTFRPTFPLMPGVAYSVRAGGREIERLEVAVPSRAPGTTARIYPTGDVLPSNQLKLYAEFSAPMMLGESQRRIRLLDGAGEEVRHAFLVLDEEMWDPARRRLTVLFDPGRVKRGLKANRESGAPLREGATYTVVIDGAWPDADGMPMTTGISKRFVVGRADRNMPSPRTWEIEPPRAGTAGPLKIRFDEAMDYAVALNAIQVVDDHGRRVDGSAGITSAEREWSFTPTGAWRDEPYTVVVDSRIEDLAGNNLDRLFDVDLKSTPLRTDGAQRLRFVPTAMLK